MGAHKHMPTKASRLDVGRHSTAPLWTKVTATALAATLATQGALPIALASATEEQITEEGTPAPTEQQAQNQNELTKEEDIALPTVSEPTVSADDQTQSDPAYAEEEASENGISDEAVSPEPAETIPQEDSGDSDGAAITTGGTTAGPTEAAFDPTTVSEQSTAADTESPQTSEQNQAPAPPVPGADAPTSPTDETTRADVSAYDFLTEEQISQALISPFANDGQSRPNFADILVYAEQYIGIPYVWGGKDFYRDGGFDCSGFVAWVYNNICHVGIDADNENAAMIYYDRCTPVSRKDAKPGDLVFFTGTYGGDGYISHVGIYCGNDIMIDAGDPIGYDYIDSIRTESGEKAPVLFGRLNGADLEEAPFDLSVSGRLLVGDQQYTGEAVTPSPTVIAANSVLAEGVDYTVSYANNVNPGTASVTITGTGNYQGTISSTFNIVDTQLPDETYVISTAMGGRVIDIYGGSMQAGAATQLFEPHGGENQMFAVTRLPDGYYSITNVKSGLSLSSCANVTDLVDGAPVTQGSPSNSLANEWMIRQVDGSYVISSAYDSAMVLSVRNGENANEASLEMRRYTGSQDQMWSFSSGTSQVPPNSPSGWHTEGGLTYYLANGTKLMGEQQISGSWYYFDPSNGGAMATGFVRLSDAYLDGGPKTVYYDTDGRMAHGERQIDGSWYYFDPSSGGMAASQLVTLSGSYLDGGPKTVYYDADGRMVHRGSADRWRLVLLR